MFTKLINLIICYSYMHETFSFKTCLTFYYPSILRHGICVQLFLFKQQGAKNRKRNPNPRLLRPLSTLDALASTKHETKWPHLACSSSQSKYSVTNTPAINLRSSISWPLNRTLLLTHHCQWFLNKGLRTYYIKNTMTNYKIGNNKTFV